MELIVKPHQISSIKKERIYSFAKERDYYQLNRNLTAGYIFSVGGEIQINDEDGLFVIISSSLICINQIELNLPCSLFFTEPPSIAFTPNAEGIVVQVNSYGNLLGKELVDKDVVIDELKRIVDVCQVQIEHVGIVREDMLDLIDDMNPDFKGVLKLNGR